MASRHLIRGSIAALIVGAGSVAGSVAGSARAGSDEPPPGARLPDIVEAIPSHLQIQNTKQREWLRFSTTHINIGDGNLQIRGGGQIAPCVIDGVAYDQCTTATQELLDASGAVVWTQPAGVAVFHPAHNHWHQSDVALFDIRADLAGPPIVATAKVTFCLVDVEFTGATGSLKKAQPRTYWECNGDLQGLAAGWADSYHQSTPQQELDITGLPAGTYYLTHLADPENQWRESDETNNFSWVKFRLTRTSSNPKVTVIDHSPCEPAVVCGFGGNP